MRGINRRTGIGIGKHQGGKEGVSRRFERVAGWTRDARTTRPFVAVISCVHSQKPHGGGAQCRVLAPPVEVVEGLGQSVLKPSLFVMRRSTVTTSEIRRVFSKPCLVYRNLSKACRAQSGN